MRNPAHNKIHYVVKILANHGDGWSFCGQLVKEAFTYTESIPGRQEITCKNCIASIGRRGRAIDRQLVGGN